MRSRVLGSRTLVAAAACLLPATGLVAACAGPSEDVDPGPSATAAPARGSSVTDLADLHDRLVGGGFVCELEYEGLRDEGRELSLCIIEGDRATLTVWDDPEVLDAFVAGSDQAGGVAVVGRNWTVDLQDPALASRVATTLQGTVVGG